MLFRHNILDSMEDLPRPCTELSNKYQIITNNKPHFSLMSLIAWNCIIIIEVL